MLSPLATRDRCEFSSRCDLSLPLGQHEASTVTIRFTACLCSHLRSKVIAEINLSPASNKESTSVQPTLARQQGTNNLLIVIGQGRPGAASQCGGALPQDQTPGTDRASQLGSRLLLHLLKMPCTRRSFHSRGVLPLFKAEECEPMESGLNFPLTDLDSFLHMPA